MTVSEFIKYLQTQPQDLQVAYQLYSEYQLLETKAIKIESLAKPRADGWVHGWPSVPEQMYLVLPGN